MTPFTKLVELDLTPRELAEVFAEMDDEAQAQFFVEVAKVMAGWSLHERDMQLHSLGRHLGACSCSSDGARSLLRMLVDTMNQPATTEAR